MSSPYAFIARENRQKVLKNLGSANVGWAYLKGFETTVRKWTDTELPFRQESNFFYLTGANEPDLHLLLNLRTGKSHLFVPRHSPDHALWCGPSLTPSEAVAQYGVDEAFYSDELSGVLKQEDAVVHVVDGTDLSTLSGAKSDASNLQTAITEARVIKSEGELELMRKAAKASGEAHIALMKAVRPGEGNESTLQALFEYECFRRGGRYQAYTPIVAGAHRGAILHYINNNAPIPTDPRQLLLVDAACEVDCYAADITRTYPVGGKYEGDWKTVYHIVLDMQKAVLSQMKAGVEWENMHRLAEKVAGEGLTKAGLLQGSLEDLLANHIPALFFPHGLGHLIGLDVHDCGGYPAGVERINEPGIRYLRMRRKLEVGMVVTVEPGLYFVPGILDEGLADPKKAKYINREVLERFRRDVGGVRIEDDVVVEANGIENLTGWVPKEIEDVERIMAT
ncbi:hypothetical protein HK097_002343 [Rhizophlyctis rosea]|uniref:Aminopeptidase P N-terminal domain-containing protein n=1 Tax=Rhizophlyctis rosea TaxID=64517 RepID=A0AAD5SJQ2_9FUNG|nr:hypothetical protein HK097_002343 [Rhizophlyctis rosea]